MKITTFIILMLLLSCGASMAQTVDLSRAVIIVSPSIQSTVRESAVEILREELALRTSLSLKNQDRPGKSNIILANVHDTEVNGLRLPVIREEERPEFRPEGFRIILDVSGSQQNLWLIAADGRGIIFAAGQFLRTATLGKNSIRFDKTGEIATAPAYPIRGHQLGYRNTANSWDAWSPEQFDRYIRELALFGTNCIENIPFQDGALGPVMKYERDFMNVRMSEICDRYGLDYWVWTPSSLDLGERENFDLEVSKHADLYKSCPRLDGVFFPGGDPGKNHPRYVMPFLKAIAGELKKYHPEAGVWISLQGFSVEQVDYFYNYLDENDSDWLAGVVSGPSSPPISETRFRLPSKYRHRHYGDITHTVRCQYPTPYWDQAFALTQGREVCNPEPFHYAAIHNHYAPFTDGFLSYSDGVHDDVNKVVWSQLGWDPTQDVTHIIKEYTRFFFGESAAGEAASGIFALERNWAGPAEKNGGIETTLAFWKNLEMKHTELKGNWRWQLLVMRAYYDTYVRQRKIYEQNLEKEAMVILLKVSETGTDKAMEAALAIVNKANSHPIAPELRQKVVDYCDALYHSIGLQTSVEKYHASGPERGAILDFLDYPLNNRWWLADEFEKIRRMPSEEEKLARLEIIRSWENPGPGSYYDNISDLSKGPRVTTRKYDATDVAWWDGGMSRKRLSTQLFQNFPKLKYTDLDPNGRYLIRIAGYGEALLRIDGERVDPLVYNKELEEFKEFPVPQKLVSDGVIEISFDEPEESHLNWRQHSKVCDIWLIKR